MQNLIAEGHHQAQRGRLPRDLFNKKDTTNPLVTVITVVFNDANHIENTIRSVLSQTYENIEYIVIDGGSTDGTLDLIRKYEKSIDYWISEKDTNLYEAMNKGVAASNGVWLNFMNSGDTFLSKDTLELTMQLSKSMADVIYSDHYNYTETTSKLERVNCSIEKYRLLHQSMVYKRALHDRHGLYLVKENLTVSDYIFFNLIEKDCFIKSPHPISKNLVGGISYGKGHIRERFAVDYLFSNIGFYQLICSITIAHIKRIFRRLGG